MFNQYGKKDLKLSVQILKDQLEDLKKWSTHNDDKYNGEIYEIELLLKQIK